MNSIAEQLVIWIVNRLLTPEVIKGAEKELVVFLQALAKKSSNSIDDALVKLIAMALGVDLPS